MTAGDAECKPNGIQLLDKPTPSLLLATESSCLLFQKLTVSIMLYWEFNACNDPCFLPSGEEEKIRSKGNSD